MFFYVVLEQIFLCLPLDGAVYGKATSSDQKREISAFEQQRLFLMHSPRFYLSWDTAFFYQEKTWLSLIVAFYVVGFIVPVHVLVTNIIASSVRNSSRCGMHDTCLEINL